MLLSRAMASTSLSYAATAVLQAVDAGYQYGFDVVNISGLPGGTVYPALRRLEEAGYVGSEWEDPSVARKEQRPPRKYYRITKAGKDALSQAVSRYRLLAPAAPQRPRRTRSSRA